MSDGDDLIRVAAMEVERITRAIPAPLAEIGLRLVRRALVNEENPEVYLQELLDGIERRAQEKAAAKFG